MYFCLTIGTTVGYGDTAPSTVNGRLLFIFYVIPGICVCGAMIGEIGMLIYEQLQRGKVSKGSMDGIDCPRFRFCFHGLFRNGIRVVGKNKKLESFKSESLKLECFCLSWKV